MLDLSLKNYVDWRVAQVIPVRSGFGYRVFLKYPDGSEKTQQKSGFKTEKEAVKARSKGFHCRYYKQLLAENGLPDIRWHDLRSTYCTSLLKESFNPKAVSKLMGHAKELITMDVYADNRGIIADGVPEIEEYMKEVLPNLKEIEIFKKELLEIVVDVTEFLPDAG